MGQRRRGADNDMRACIWCESWRATMVCAQASWTDNKTRRKARPRSVTRSYDSAAGECIVRAGPSASHEASAISETYGPLFAPSP